MGINLLSAVCRAPVHKKENCMLLVIVAIRARLTEAKKAADRIIKNKKKKFKRDH
jgi:hypothetical protein